MINNLIGWPEFAQILKQYGPVVAILGALVWWMARRIDRLIDRNSDIYEKEILRLAAVQDRLLTALLGKQESSATSPSIEQIKKDVAEDVQKKDPQKEKPDGKAGSTAAGGTA